jgi:hypothetical protein
VREANSLRLGDQAEQCTVAVETPRTALLHQVEPRLIVTIEQFVRHLAGWRLVSELERLGAEPLHADDDHHRVWHDAPDCGIRLKLFEFNQWLTPGSGRDTALHPFAL